MEQTEASKNQIPKDLSQDQATNTTIHLPEADKLYLKGRYSEAFTLYKQSLEKFIISSSESIAISDLYHRCGLAALKCANYANASIYLQMALTKKKETKNENSRGISRITLDIGSVCLEEAKYTEALEHFKNAYELISDTSKDNCLEAAIYYNKSAEYELCQCNYEGVLKCASKSMTANPNRTIEQKAEFARSCDLAGWGHAYMKDYNNSLLQAEKSFAIRKELYGESHPEIGLCYKLFGSIQDDLYNYDASKQSYYKAIEIYNKFLSEYHPLIADVYNNLGIVQEMDEDLTSALESYQKSLKINLKCKGENHPSVARNYRNIGDIHFNRDEYEKAIDMYSNELEIQIKFYGEDHLRVSACYNNIANVHQKLRQYDLARNYYTNSLHIRLKHSKRSYDVAASYDYLGTLDAKQFKYAEAFENRMKSLKVRLALPNDRGLGHSFYNLILLFKDVRDFSLARDCSRKAVQVYTRILGNSHRDTRDAKTEVSYTTKKADLLCPNNDSWV